jgi:hypothetical protein
MSEHSPIQTSRQQLTPAQRRNVDRVETVVGLAAPFLDLLLAVGDRISRIAEPQDYEYYPIRSERMPGDDGSGPPAGD